MSRLLDHLRNECGAAAVETAILLPVLIMLSFGGFEISRMVSRQHALQNGVAEAEEVALAANAGAHTDTLKLKAMLKESLQLSDDQVLIEKRYRCNTDQTLIAGPDCGEGAVVSTYLRLRLRDTQVPFWRDIGIGADFHFDVERTVQLS